MDRVGSRNTLIVLLTIAVLTVLAVGTALWRWGHGQHVDVELIALITTLVGFLTGTQVDLGARPSVHAARALAESVAFDVRQAAEIPTTVNHYDVSPTTPETPDTVDFAPPES